MHEGPVRINLAVLEDVNLIVRKQNAVAIFRGREIDSQRAGQRHRFVPRLDFLIPIFVDVRSLLHKGRSLVPRLGVLFLHGLDELLGRGNCGGERICADQQNKKNYPGESLDRIRS